MDLFPSKVVERSEPNPAGPGLAERWRGWMSKPENAALLMQTGIAMLQPQQLGETTLGNTAKAVGEGFQARDRVRQNATANQNSVLKQSQDAEELRLRGKEIDSRSKYYDNMGGGKGVTATSIFSRENRQRDSLRNFLLKQAASATEMIFDEEEKSQKMQDLLGDQTWLDQQATNFMATEATADKTFNGNVGSVPLAPELGAPAASNVAPSMGGPSIEPPTKYNAQGQKAQFIGGKWVIVK